MPTALKIAPKTSYKTMNVIYTVIMLSVITTIIFVNLAPVLYN